jgi:TIGR03009 family protein
MIHRLFCSSLCLMAALGAASARSQEQAPLTFDAAPSSSAPAYGQPPQYAPPVAGAPATAAGAPVAAPAISPGAAAAAPVTPTTPAPPFVLSEAEMKFVYQTLRMWEAESAKITTFKSDFERQEFDAVWNPGSDKPMKVSYGVVSYSKPDQGSFKIDRIMRWVKTDPKSADPAAPGSFVDQPEEIGEHWVCDGKAVYEYDHRLKQLKVTAIPEDMRGLAIADGPLPFIFGAKANNLMERYWIQPYQSNEQQIWLIAYPRRSSDAANYDYVDVMLDRKTMQPKNMRIHLPGGKQKHLYTFGSEDSPPVINGKLDALFGGLFGAPHTPLGWKKVVMSDTELPPATPAAPGPQAAIPGLGSR